MLGNVHVDVILMPSSSRSPRGGPDLSVAVVALASAGDWTKFEGESCICDDDDGPPETVDSLDSSGGGGGGGETCDDDIDLIVVGSVLALGVAIAPASVVLVLPAARFELRPASKLTIPSSFCSS